MRGSPHLLGGEPPPVRFVYWLLIAIYTFAALAQGALTGDELVCAAAAVPALVLSAPVLGAQLASAVTDAAAGLLPSPEAESEEWHATMDAWLDSFMSSYRSQHHHDRRSSIIYLHFHIHILPRKAASSVSQTTQQVCGWLVRPA